MSRYVTNLILFRAPIVRCWLIEPCQDGWRGRTVGIPEPDAKRTEVGELRQVLFVLTQRNSARMGLPIVQAGGLHSERVAA